jgi:hypothetical protein
MNADAVARNVAHPPLRYGTRSVGRGALESRRMYTGAEIYDIHLGPTVPEGDVCTASRAVSSSRSETEVEADHVLTELVPLSIVPLA